MRFALPCASVLAFATSALCADAASPVTRYRNDEDGLAWMKATYPNAAEKFAQGEALLFDPASRADVERAAELFTQAFAEAPQSELAGRRKCQALTELGRHEEAVRACTDALNEGQSGLTIRAMVGALMSGPNPPTPSEVGFATAYARRLRRLMPQDPWPAAADCDIGRKLGDTDMLNHCVEELERIAPEHYETKRAAAWLAALRPGWGVLSAWLAVVLAAIATAAHAIVRSRKSSRQDAHAKLGVAACVVLGAFTSWPRAAFADTEAAGASAGAALGKTAGHLSKYSIDDQDPLSSIPTPVQRDNDPLEYGYLLMDLGDRADKASKHGDHLAAARYYAALAKAVPDVAISFRKACEEYSAANDREDALKYCGPALNRDGVVLADYSHYAELVFSKKGKLEPAEVETLDAIVDHLKVDDAAVTVAWDIECNLGVRLGDLKRLGECAPALALKAPEDPKAVFYEWAYAMQQGKFSDAEKFVARAKRVSTDKVQVKAMEAATYKAMPLWRKGFRDWRVGATAAVALFAGLALMLRRGHGAKATGLLDGS